MKDNIYQTTVGLEIHVELKTATKMFCACANDPFESSPNKHVCPICYGLPGALPLLNQKAIAQVIRLGRALNGTIAPESFWARKNYFYPDLPKGYQISQSTSPLVSEATLTIDGVNHRIARIHLEEDAAKLFHRPDGTSGVDYNRAGVPLIEIVTHPDFHSAEEAKRFSRELQTLLRQMGLSDASMEKGQMRCEANISVAPVGTSLGQKVEVKNINSFRALGRSIEYEAERQRAIIASGGKIEQETRAWDEASQATRLMRRKETSADYRYFPEPDLPSVKLDLTREEISFLPEEDRRSLEKLGIGKDQAEVIVRKGLSAPLFVLIARKPNLAKLAGRLVISSPTLLELALDDQERILEAVSRLDWSNATTQTVIRALAKGKRWEEATAGFNEAVDIAQLASQVVSENESAVRQYQSGKEAALNFLLGQLMKKARGAVGVGQAREALRRALDN